MPTKKTPTQPQEAGNGDDDAPQADDANDNQPTGPANNEAGDKGNNQTTQQAENGEPGPSCHHQWKRKIDLDGKIVAGFNTHRCSECKAESRRT